MMKMRKWVTLSCACALFLTGCWDNVRLRDASFVYGLGLDQQGKDSFRNTYVIEKVRNANQGGGEKVSDVITANGASIFEASRSADLKMTDSMEFRTAKLLVLSKELARQDLFSLLQPILRMRATPLSMKVVLADGEASELLQTPRVGQQQTVDYLIDIVKNGEAYTHIPKNNLQNTFEIFMDDGRDFGLPVFKKEEDRLVLASLALIHGTKYTGESLSIPESTLLTLLRGEKGKVALLSQKREKKVISVFVRHVSQKMDIHEKDGDIAVRVMVQMKASMIEGAISLPDEEKQELERTLSRDLTERAGELMKKVQKANCDFLGVGRELNAYHHDAWTKLDWEKAYPQIKIEPQVQVEIINAGILN